LPDSPTMPFWLLDVLGKRLARYELTLHPGKNTLRRLLARFDDRRVRRITARAGTLRRPHLTHHRPLAGVVLANVPASSFACRHGCVGCFGGRRVGVCISASGDRRGAPRLRRASGAQDPMRSAADAATPLTARSVDRKGRCLRQGRSSGAAARAAPIVTAKGQRDRGHLLVQSGFATRAPPAAGNY
jgi:hypothetical protein